MKNLHIIGVTRFAYTGRGGYQIGHDSIEERLAFLFNPARIEQRFRLFEHVTIPALKAQTDPDFMLIVVTSQNIPEQHLDRLATILEPMPQVALVLKEPRRHRKAMHEVVSSFIDANADATAQFRMDDDDAVATDFIAQIRSNIPKVSPIFAKHGKCALDFTKGIELFARDGNITARQTVKSNLGVAQALYLPTAAPKSVFNFPHHILNQHMPIIFDSTPDMYIRSINGTNDSRKARARPNLGEVLSDEMRAKLRNRFALNLDQLQN